jgi:hypothetical protein
MSLTDNSFQPIIEESMTVYYNGCIETTIPAYFNVYTQGFVPAYYKPPHMANAIDRSYKVASKTVDNGYTKAISLYILIAVKRPNACPFKWMYSNIYSCPK